VSMGDGASSFKEAYLKSMSVRAAFAAACLAIAFLAVGLELSFGKYGVGCLESYQLAWDNLQVHASRALFGTPLPDGWGDSMRNHVVWDMRFPRAIAGFAVGAGLGVCGAAMQSSMKNPLADPYTTGIASGASFGACLAIVLGFCILPGLHGEEAVVVNAFCFALIPAAAIVLVARKKRNATPAAMILVGIAVMYLFTASTTLMKYAASEEALADIYVWNVGTLGKATWDNAGIMLAASLLGIAFFMLMSRKLNVLAMCDRDAVTLGVDAKKARASVLVAVSLVTAVLVSFSGTIGFVGLVAPHAVRMFIGSNNRMLVPASAAFGAMMLLCSDCVAKEAGTTGLPVGVITALIGGPLFLILLIRQSKSIW